MSKRLYQAPILLDITTGIDTVSGQGSGQGSNIPDPEGKMDFDTWFEEVAWGGTNPDADYNGDGAINEADFNYYIENELWNG